MRSNLKRIEVNEIMTGIHMTELTAPGEGDEWVPENQYG